MIVSAPRDRPKPPGTAGLTAREAAERLGVDRSTVYAYASRGALRRWKAGDGRRSLYHPDDVDALARRARPGSNRRTALVPDIRIGTAISEIGDGWVRYRGHRVDELVERRRFESVVDLLWYGDRGSEATPNVADAQRIRDTVRRAVAGLDPTCMPTARLAVGLAAASSSLPVRTEARSGVDVRPLLLDALVESLPPVAAPPEATVRRCADGSLAARLWPRCTPRRATPDRLAALDTALTVLAEHQLSTSTLAVRIAASNRASPAAALLAGVATLGGSAGRPAAADVQRRILGHPDAEPLAGTGHCVHRSGDPREATLAAAVDTIASGRQLSRIEHDRRRLAERSGAAPNVDLAMGAFGYAAGMAPEVTDCLIVVARAVGWLAHIYEEYDEAPNRFRGSGVYRGVGRRGRGD